MNRSEIGSYLEAYADGELTGAELRRVEAHLAQNPADHAIIDRWRAVRAAAQRGFESEPIPFGLHGRMRDALARDVEDRGIIRLWPTLGAVAAAAAAIALAFVFGVPGFRSDAWNPAGVPVTPVVAAGDLATIYKVSACREKIDCFHVAGMNAKEAEATIAAKVPFGVHIPDLSGLGYRLAGASDCPLKMNIPAVHVYYDRSAADTPQATDPQDVVSFFPMKGRVKVTECSRTCAPGGCNKHPKRHYSVASNVDHVTILVWHECAASYAVASALQEDDLVRLVDSVDVAALMPANAPAYATSIRGETNVSPAAAAALGALLPIVPLVGRRLP